jgi:hypothetical protein
VWNLLGKGGRRAVRAAEACADLETDASALGPALAAARREADAAHAAWSRKWANLRPDARTFARWAAASAVSADPAEAAAREAAAAVAVQAVGTDPSDRTLSVGVGAAGLVVYHRPQALGGPAKAEEAAGVRRRTAALQDAWGAERQAQAGIVRCLAASIRVALDARWRTVDTLALARGIYEERAFDRLPLLADALMDAGCNDEQILAHCHGEGPHVRGCWVVDLVLNKE